MTEPVRVFVSYSRKDQGLKDRLLEGLSGLQREGLVTVWHDRQIDAGDTWAREIDNQLEIADVILLLISPSFLSSDYCYGVELSRALERHDRGEARIIPILLRPVDWGRSQLKEIHALPDGGRPVTQWASEDEAFQSVSLGIRNVIGRLEARPPQIATSDAGESPKYYLYISDTKVDMLFPQVPIATRIAVGSTSGISDGRPLEERTEFDRTGNRIFKLRSVVRFLTDRAWIGSIDDPKEYFGGIADMNWGYTHRSIAARNTGKPYVYFTGSTERTTFLLSASAKYLIGEDRVRPGGFSSSSVPHVIDALSAEIDRWSEESAASPPQFAAGQLLASHEKKDLPYTGLELALDMVDVTRRHMSGVSQSLEFLAKPLLRGLSPRYNNRTNILGSPLYVALAL